MRTDVLILVLVTGAATWAFRFLPLKFDLSGLSPTGRVSKLLSAMGPAAITALFVSSVLGPLSAPLSGQAPLWAGSLTVLALWFWRKSVVLATLGGAAVYGAVFALIA